MTNLNGKTAFITGASGSIGRAITKKLHGLGAYVFISGSNEGKLVELGKELENNYAIKTCDLSDVKAAEQLIADIEKLDILVCNAGINRDNLAVRMTEEDFGSWVFGLMEYSIAPRWIFEISGMYNFDPKKPDARGRIEKTLYPTFGAVFNQGSNRFSLRYVKQVEGVVCSGGICRLEPAFSGVRFSMNTIF